MKLTILEAYEQGKMLAVLSFVRMLLEPAMDSKVRRRQGSGLPRWMCWRESWQDGLEALAFKRGLRADAKSHVGYMFTIT